MKYFFRYFIPFMIFFSYNNSLYSEYYTRNELLDEGRRSVNTLSKYILISNEKYPAHMILYWDEYEDFEVDTNYGEDKVRINIIDYSNKITFGSNWISFYFIIQNYSFVSINRQYVDMEYKNNIKVYTPKDGINYGSLTDVFWNFDLTFLKQIKFNIGGIYSMEKINNVEYDKEKYPGINQDQSGININEEGERLYKEVREVDRKNYKWIYGLNLFSFFQSTVALANSNNNIDSSRSILFYSIGETLGTITAGHTYYKYWDNENGYIFQWQKVFSILGFGGEYLSKERMISEIFFEISTPDTYNYFIKLKGNYARTPETVLINNSNKFLKGGRIALGYTASSFCKKKVKSCMPCVHIEIHVLYNEYERLKIFRKSMNNLGSGVSFGMYF